MIWVAFDDAAAAERVTGRREFRQHWPYAESPGRTRSRTAEALFPMALEMAWIQLKLNLLAHEHGVVDEDFSCTRVDLLVDDTFADCVRGMQKHHDAIRRPGWAR